MGSGLEAPRPGSAEGYRYFVVIPGALGFPPSLFLRRPGSRDEALCRVGEHGRDWAPHEKLRRAEVGGTTDDIIEVSPAVAEEVRRALIEYAATRAAGAQP
ncbi:MAG: hypothetical protein KBF43_14360, partial [Dermatophilaceae bacterium]|nr:hypothetical protein [Dermatophilaceae bacterium]